MNINFFGSSREEKDRKKWDEYDRTGRSVPRGTLPTTPRVPNIYPDTRDGRSSLPAYSDIQVDRWNNGSSSSSSTSRER